MGRDWLNAVRLQHFEHGGGILIAQSHRHRLSVDRLRRRESGVSQPSSLANSAMMAMSFLHVEIRIVAGS